MNSETNKNKSSCCRESIFAYLDGELSPGEEMEIELHFAECKRCAEDINAQKKVSNSLEIILEDELKNIELPENFTKIVTAKAESNVSGLRQRKEIPRAFLISAALLFLVTIGLGAKVDSIGNTFTRIAEQFSAVLGFVLHFVYDLAIGISVVGRSLCHKFVFSSVISLVVIVVFFVVAFLSLSRLILRHNRT